MVHIASAFFVVYQLNALKLSYFEFGLVAAMHPLASILTFKYWGKMIDKFGSKKVLLVAGILLTLNPILWLFANVGFLIFIELLAGFAWAGFNASSFTYSLQLLPTRGKTNYVAFTNSLDGMGIAIGAFASGFIADFFIRLNVPGFEGLRGLLLLFCLSGVLRLLLTFSFLPLIEPSRKVRVSSQEFLKVAFLYPLNEFRMSFNNGIHKLRHFRLKLLKK